MPGSLPYNELAAFSQEYASQHNFSSDPIVSSHLLAPLIDYCIAQNVDTRYFLYFGSQNPKGLFPQLVRDVLKRGTESHFYGHVLCTDSGAINRENDGGQWDFHKNMAFWAGGMDAARAFYLLTDIAWYYNKGKPDPLSGTCQEILWLMDNGYTAIPDPKNRKCTIFLPSKNPPVFSIFRNIPNENDTNVKRLALLIREILSRRNAVNLSEDHRFMHPTSLPAVCESQHSSRFFQEPKEQSASLPLGLEFDSARLNG